MNDQPPRPGRWLLRWIYDDEHFDEVVGDLEELYRDRLHSRGRFVASVLYLKDVVLALPNLKLFRLNPAMIRNLVTIAFRSLKKRMSYTIINIAGLATSIAFAFLLWLYVSDQASYDRDLSLVDRTYRVNIECDMNGKVDIYSCVPQPVAAALKSSYPQVEHIARASFLGGVNTFEYNGKKGRVNDLVFADPDILKIFERDFIHGDPATALSLPNSVVITESTALSLFGQTDVLGRVVRFKEHMKDLKISGVIADRRNTHFVMNVIISWDTFKEYEADWWYGGHVYTYFILNEKNDIETLAQQMPAFFDRYMKKTFDEFNGKGRLFFQPLRDIYLSDELVWEPNSHGSRTNVLALTIVAMVLVVFAIINYVNLATAQAADRAMEVSIRKTMGSSRQLLWGQFLCESILLSIGAALLSIVIAWLLIPFFNGLSGLDLHVRDFFAPLHIVSILALAVTVGFLAGVFPAFYLSSSPAVNSLKGKFSGSRSGEILRRVLVTTQYFIAALLISGILLVYDQVVFIKDKDIGFHRENLLNIQLSQDTVVNDHIGVFIDDLMSSAKVRSASLAFLNLHQESNAFTPVLQNEDGTKFNMGADIMYVSADFIKTIGAEIIMGRDFDKNITNEPDQSILINEAAVRKFGWQKNPLGGKFVGFTADEPTDRRVIGVVKDFHLGVSYRRINPTIIVLINGNGSNLYVRIDSEGVKEAVAMIRDRWDKHFPGYELHHSFVDEDLRALYSREDKFLSLLTSFCVVIIFIASLGIIGLISYTTHLRRKEIAIRKLLGSTFNNTVALLSRKFIVLVVVANLLAIPATWFLIRLWLSNFSYRADVSPWAFVVPFAICLAFTGFSIAWHTTQAARANPVDALKCE